MMLIYCLYIANILLIYCSDIAYKLLTYCLYFAYMPKCVKTRQMININFILLNLLIYCLYIYSLFYIAYILLIYCLYIAYTVEQRNLQVAFIDTNKNDR